MLTINQVPMITHGKKHMNRTKPAMNFNPPDLRGLDLEPERVRVSHCLKLQPTSFMISAFHHVRQVRDPRADFPVLVPSHPPQSRHPVR